MVNEEYWKNYYATHEQQEPSAFAVWARPRVKGVLVIDVGSGDGRDTEYLDGVGVEPTNEQAAFPMSAQVFMSGWTSLPTDTVYARWFLHAVEEEVEDQLLEWTQGQLLVEARVEGDKVDDTHWRRPINTTKFLEKLIRLNYEITYFEVSRNFAPPGFPLLFRVDAKRKGVSSSR